MQVEDHDLTEEDLKDVLKEVMQQIENDDDFDDEEKGGTRCRGMLQKKQDVQAKMEEEDVSEAVKWILQHFGHKEGKEGAQEAEEEDEVCAD